MSSTHDATKVAGLIVLRCEENGDKLTARKLQDILYFVQKQFIMEDNVPCFKDRIWVGEDGIYVQAVENALKFQPGGDLSYEILKELFPIKKKMDPHSMAVMRRAVDPSARMTEAMLLSLMKIQMPFQNGMKTGLISLEDLHKAVGRH